jgi:hydroxypyruvate reductase/glycerate 2-kinase
VLERFALTARVPQRALRHLRLGAAGELPETLKKPAARVRHVVLGNNRGAVDAAARTARSLGYGVLHLSSCVEGESREVGVVLAGIARGLRDEARSRGPLCVLSGGETTVRLPEAHGRGGRNQELVLAAVEHLWDDGLRDLCVLSGGTDGEDGPTDAAGAAADAAVVRAARRRGLDPAAHLLRHDAYPFFGAVGGLLRTGRTRTNVMDLRVIIVGAPGASPRRK